MIQENDPDDARRAAFAIECRAVRLWLAKNPGSSGTEISRAIGHRCDWSLAKLANMGLVECKRGSDKSGRLTALWFVVPQ